MAVLATVVTKGTVPVSRIEANRLVNRFPTPTTAWGFTMDLIYDIYGKKPIGLESPFWLMGSLLPEGTHVEPTVGQIWPRIG